jgi:hypothetical protein
MMHHLPPHQGGTPVLPVLARGLGIATHAHSSTKGPYTPPWLEDGDPWLDEDSETLEGGVGACAGVRASGRAICKDAHAYTWSGSGGTSTHGRQRTGSYSVRRLALVYMTPGGGVAVSQALS